MNQFMVDRVHLQSVDSTNAYVRRRLSAGRHFAEITLVDTDDQTAGRGQKGNSWECEPGKNLAFSLVCHPSQVPASHQFILSQAIALAVCESLSEFADGFTVKWPNDIYWNDYKVSGTLIECDLLGKQLDTCIIGTGVNVNQTVFVSDAPNPMSLGQIVGASCDREALLASIVREFVRLYSLIQRGHDELVRAEYVSRLYRSSGLWPFEDANGRFEAGFAGIEPTGHLLLRTAGGELRRYEFKEVRFVLPF